MKRVIFWGATGQARVLKDAMNSSTQELVAIFDNRKIESPFSGVPIYVGRDGFNNWLATQVNRRELHACVAIGGARGADRLELQNWLYEQGLPPLTVVHERAFVAPSTSIGAGCQILAMSAVAANANLGRSVIVNTAATIDHDCTIGDGVHIAPGAHIAGEVCIDDFAFIGMGALILPRLHIGRGVVIGAGAVVTKNVATGDTVVGVPAKIVDHKQPRDL